MEFERLCKPLESNSFMLFGARGTGKTSLINKLLPNKKLLSIDLLAQEAEDRYSRNPDLLYDEIKTRFRELEWVVLDEIQKVPLLLNTVHRILESKKFNPPKFAITGSSARKLKLGGANLLAGRAFVYHLFPLTSIEIGDRFDLSFCLNWGALPKIFQYNSDEEIEEFLRSYALTYLKEEVWAEHLVQKLEPFRKFLEVAAQSNGEIVNFANIAKDVDADEKTVKKYFQILEDTLLGFFLEPYSKSVRKQQIKSPKFFFFDCGVVRALARTLKQKVVENTYVYGKAFEHFIVAEIFRLNEYLRKDYRLSYLRTKDDAEIDIIIERPGQKDLLIEIKSSKKTDERATTHLRSLANQFNSCELLCLSNDLHQRIENNVHYLHWRNWIGSYF